MTFFWNIVVIAALLVAAAWFAMSEIALAGSRKLKLIRMAENGDVRAKHVLGLKENPGNFFSVIQIGINAVAILGGIVGDAAFKDVFTILLGGIVPEAVLSSAAFVCSFVLVTFLFVIFADLVPKRVAMSKPEDIAVMTVRSMRMLIVILKPLVWILAGLSDFIMKLLGVSTKPSEKITNEDVVATVEAAVAAGVMDPAEKSAITNVMDLESRLVPSAMTARDCIVAFDLGESGDSIAEKLRQSPHDRFLVVDKSIDNVVGAVESKEILKCVTNGERISLKDKGLVNPVLSVPDSLTLSETLDLFKSQKTDFAVVINEYALTVGIITLKDILWVIMGDYVPQQGDAQIVRRDETSWLIEGATPIDDVEKRLCIASMPEEDSYETMAGFVMYMLRRVPRVTDKFEYAGFRFEIVDIDRNRVDRVLVTLMQTEPDAQASTDVKIEKDREANHE